METSRGDVRDVDVRKKSGARLRYAEEAHARFERERITSTLPERVDVVVSGGGFKVCLAGGLAIGLKRLGCSGVRFAGASAGAQAAFMMRNDDMDSAVRWALAVAETLRRFPLMYPAPLWEIFYKRKALQHGPPPKGDFVVSMTRITRKVLGVPVAGEAWLCDDFPTADDLGEALIGTAAVPLLLTSGLTRNTPEFSDGRRAQLVVSWDQLPIRLKARTAGLPAAGV